MKLQVYDQVIWVGGYLLTEVLHCVLGSWECRTASLVGHNLLIQSLTEKDESTNLFHSFLRWIINKRKKAHTAIL